MFCLCYHDTFRDTLRFLSWYVSWYLSWYVSQRHQKCCEKKFKGRTFEKIFDRGCDGLRVFAIFRQELNDTICVRYDLWDNHPDDHRKHGKRRGGSSHSKGHDRPRDKRSAASYMKSFRAFKQRCEKSELVDATSTPRYTSFGITADSNMPPSYWELPRHRGRWRCEIFLFVFFL